MATIPTTLADSSLSRKKTGPSYRTALITSLVAAAVLCCFWTALGWGVIPTAQRHDFLTTYTAARMAANGEYARLHDPVLMFQRMREIDPTALGAPVVRPHYYAFLVSPLALMSHHTAFWVWLGLQVMVLFGCWFWAVKRFGPDALIWGALSIPCSLGIFHGQDSVLMLAIMIGGYALARRKHPWSAGAVWALALMKFHLVLFLAPAMLISKRWRMLGGFASMGSVLAGWSLALAGTEGLKNYIALLRNKDLERLNPTPEMMISVQGLLANLNLSSEILSVGLGLIAVVAAALVIRRDQPLWRWTTLAMTTSLFAAPHVYGYDAALLVLPIWLVQAYSASPATRISFAIFATPLPFLVGLGGSPWSILSPICLAACFVSVAWEAATSTAGPVAEETA